jgi:endonuclease YncB( thermonuclease family)
MKARPRAAALLLLLAHPFFPAPGGAHAGKLDRCGCHRDNRAGGYHCHEGVFSGRSFKSREEGLRVIEASEGACAKPPARMSPPAGMELRGKVVGVMDGDTLEILARGRAVRIRLFGVDCPEKRQAFGQRARQFSSQMAFGKEVRVEARDTDRYGRTVGEVFLGEKSLNRELVKAGLAWWYRRYAPGDEELRRLEEAARRERRGLWADKAPIAPWEWRRRPFTSPRVSASPSVFTAGSGKPHGVENPA